MNEMITLVASLFHYGMLVLFGVAVMACFLDIPKTKRNIVILFAVAALLMTLELVLFLTIGEEYVAKLYPLITHLPLVLFFALFYKKRPFQVILALTITYLGCQIINWISLVATHFNLDAAVIDMTASLLLILLGFIISRFFSPSVAKLLCGDNKMLAVYAIIPMLYYIYDYLVTVYTDPLEVPSIVSVEFMPFVISFAYLIFSVIYQKQSEAYYEARRKSQILSIQLNQYESMQTRIEETKRARHDLRQHLRLIMAYIDSGDNDALAEYVKNYGESLPDDIERRFCENAVADAVVRFYTIKAEENGIDIETTLHIPAKLNISDPDLCVLLGNLLENALEECLRHKGELCKITVSAQTRGTRSFIITVDNSPAHKPKISDGILLSSKGARYEGIGTGSIKNIAERYNGEAKFEWKDGTFFASVVVILPSDDISYGK